MNYSKGLLLYQDEPAPGTLLKFIFTIVPAMLLITSIYLFSSGERTGGLVLIAEALIIGIILRTVLPRSYQVYEDRLRIVLGGPFSLTIKFEQINKIEVTRSWAPAINFVTTITMSEVRIVKKRGLSVAITPEHRELFVSNANQALTQWVKRNKYLLIR